MIQTILAIDEKEKYSRTWTLEELNDCILPEKEIVANDDLPKEDRFWDTLNLEAMQNEEWKELPLLNRERWWFKYRSIKKFEVSNIGRVRIINGNNEIKVIGQSTYDKTNLALVDYKAFEHGKVYLLVAKVWLKDTRPEGSKGWAVHHIDNNGRNNKPENLIWLSPGDHSKVNHKK